MEQHKATHDRRPLSVLVETDDPALAICDFVAFADAGFDVVVCTGPADDQPCPALAGRSCPTVTRADVVMNAMRDAAARRSLLEAVRATTPTAAMVVCALDDEALPDGCVPLPPNASISAQTAALRHAAFSDRSQ